MAFPYMSISFHLAETKRILEEDKQLMRDIIRLTPRTGYEKIQKKILKTKMAEDFLYANTIIISLTCLKTRVHQNCRYRIFERGK